MDIHYCYNRKNEIIDFLKNSFEELTSKDYSIPITFSNETPPIFFDRYGKFKEHDLDKYPIDDLMGVYYLTTRSIVIYLQGIHRAVNELSDIIAIPNFYENLMTIVILHEIGHYWFHNVKIDAKNYSLVNNYSLDPKILNPTIGEWIAQMFTYLCIKENDDLLNAMEELVKVLPIEYQSFKNYYTMDISEFKRSAKAFQFVPSDIWKDDDFQGTVNSSVKDYSKIGIKDAIKIATDEAQLFNDVKLFNT
jgi:hypothetical protein